MKKLLLILTALAVLAGCQTYNWDFADENIPDSLRQQSEAMIEEKTAFIEENGDSIPAYFEIAYANQTLGDYKEAVKWYEEVLVLDANHFVSLNNLADIHEQVGDYETSALYIMRLYVLDQAGYEAIKDTVRILLKNEDPMNAAHAVDEYEKKLTDPTDADTQFINSLRDDINEWYESNS
jgi:tetratricopeptide (TPR) repeat protein